MDAINSAALHFAESEVYSPRLSWAQPFSQELMQQAMWFASVNNGYLPNGLLKASSNWAFAEVVVEHTLTMKSATPHRVDGSRWSHRSQHLQCTRTW